MSKVWLVARAEYLKAIRTKAFIISVILMPVLMGGSFIVMGLAEAAKDVDDQHFAVLDHSGLLRELIAEQAETRNGSDIWSKKKPGEQREPRYVLTDTPEGEGETVEIALADKVRDGELLGYLVIGRDVFAAEPPDGADRRLAWHTESPTVNDLSDWLEAKVNAAVQERRFAEAGLDQELVGSLTAWLELDETDLPKMSASGEVVAGEKSDTLAMLAVPGVLMMLIYMLTLMNAPALMNNVLEEKIQKIAEVLVSSVSPGELLTGKLISSILMALTLTGLYVGAGLVFMFNVDKIPPVMLESLTPRLFGLFGFFLLMELIMVGSICSALGAACSELQDAQTLMFPVIMLCVVPMFFIGVVINDPNGTVSQLASFFPTATPMLMFLRATIQPGVAMWELVAGVVWMLLCSAGCLWAAAKIFRIGILSQGQTPSMRRLAGWVISR